MINDAGTALGSGLVGSNQVQHALLQNKGFGIVDLSVRPEDANVATYGAGINQLGHEVGGRSYPFADAILWKDGNETVLPSLPDAIVSAANSINDGDVIVGFSYSLGAGHAVKWENLSPTDLNALIPSTADFTLTNAVSINDKGQILYPRFEMFQQIVETFRKTGKSVPVFCD